MQTDHVGELPVDGVKEHLSSDMCIAVSTALQTTTAL